MIEEEQDTKELFMDQKNMPQFLKAEIEYNEAQALRNEVVEWTQNASDAVDMLYKTLKTYIQS